VAEFRIQGDASRRERRSRVLSWGTILLLLAVTASVFALRACGDLSANSDLRFLAAYAFLGAVIGASLVGFREVLHRAERRMVFVLNDNEIVRKRQGYPDVRIAFTEIATLGEELRWLIIRSAAPQRKIAIPNSVGGYDKIRAELAKHHPVSVPAPGSVGPLLGTFGLLAVAILSWTAVVCFRGMVVIVPAIVGLTTLAIGTWRMWTLLNRRLWRPLVWAAISSAWLVALFLIYLRVVRS